MPYKSVAELPKEVKALGSEKASQWLSVFNSVFQKTKDEGEAAKQAWGAVKKTTEEKFTLDLELFSEGIWNGEKFTSDHIEGIIAAFHELKEEFLPRIKLGHQDNQIDTALGVIDSLWKKGNKLMGRIIDMPKIVYEAIKSKLFQGVSVELMVDYESTKGSKYPFVLDAAAILGSQLPAVKDLAGLTAYMKDNRSKGKFLLKRTFDEKEKEKKMVDVDEKTYNELLAFKDKAQRLCIVLSLIQIFQNLIIT